MVLGGAWSRWNSPRWNVLIGSTTGACEPIGYLPPAEFEAAYYQQAAAVAVR